MTEHAETEAITVPLDAALFQSAVELAHIAKRLRRHVKNIPGGAVHESVVGVIIRVAAASDVLGEQAREVEAFWRTTEVGD